MTRYIFRGCPRCGGDLYINYHHGNQDHWRCLQCGRHPCRRQAHPPASSRGDTLLAIDAGALSTGWAVFHNHTLADTGHITPARGADRAPDERISHIICELERLRGGRRPGQVALCQPAGFHWQTPTLALLSNALRCWAADAQLPLAEYSTEEVWPAVAGHPRPSRQRLAFAVMENQQLLGACKSPPEWAAIAVGSYHLANPPGADSSDPDRLRKSLL